MHSHVYIIMCMERLSDFSKCISVIINCLCRRTQENTTIWKNLASLSKSDTLLPTGIFLALFEEACLWVIVLVLSGIGVIRIMTRLN